MRVACDNEGHGATPQEAEEAVLMGWPCIISDLGERTPANVPSFLRLISVGIDALLRWIDALRSDQVGWPIASSASLSCNAAAFRAASATLAHAESIEQSLRRAMRLLLTITCQPMIRRTEPPHANRQVQRRHQCHQGDKLHMVSVTAVIAR
jgi:hypothetical protein